MEQSLTKWLFYGLILLAVVIEVVADVLFKQWATDKKAALFIGGLLIYSLGTVFWAFSLRYEYLSKAVTIFTILNLIIVVGVGVLFFKEDLSLANKLGIGLGIASILLLELF